MPGGFLSRIIYALIGKSASPKNSDSSGASAADNAGPKDLRGAAAAQEDSGAKEWIPEIIAKQRQKDLSAHAKGVMQPGIHNEIPENMHMHEDQFGTGAATHKKSASGGFLSAIRNLKKRHLFSTGSAAVAVLLLALAFTPLFSYFKAIIVIIALILIGAASKLIQKFFPFVVGFDLCLFFTVIVSVAYHPFAGVLVGVFSSVLGSVARGQDDMSKVIVPAIGYIVVALLVPFFSGMQLFTIGMILTLVYSIMMSVAFWFLMHCSTNTLTFLISSLAFNYWLFTNYATSLMAFITG